MCPEELVRGVDETWWCAGASLGGQGGLAGWLLLRTRRR
jgi:hypothetical protein